MIPWRARGDWDLLAAAKATQALRAAGVRVAHCHDARSHALGVPAARLAGVPAVVVSRRVSFPVGTNPLSALKYRLPVDRYLCVSRGVTERLRVAGVPERRLSVVADGFELQEPLVTIDLRGLLGLPAETPLVGTVAALTPEKGHADLLEAAAYLVSASSPAHFVWLGEGECRWTLLRRRAELNLESRVHLLGYRADAQALLRQCTVFALPSLEEGLGTSLIEALALGVPVVATAVGGTAGAARRSSRSHRGASGGVGVPRTPAPMERGRPRLGPGVPRRMHGGAHPGRVRGDPVSVLVSGLGLGPLLDLLARLALRRLVALGDDLAGPRVDLDLFDARLAGHGDVERVDQLSVLALQLT